MIIILYLLIILKRKKQTNLRNSARGDCWTTNPGNGNTPMIFDDEFVVECVWKIFWILLLILLNIKTKPKNAEHCANLKNTQKISSSLMKKKISNQTQKKILLNCHDEPRLLKTFSLIYNYIYISIWSLHHMLFFSLLGSYLFHKWELWC